MTSNIIRTDPIVRSFIVDFSSLLGGDAVLDHAVDSISSLALFQGVDKACATRTDAEQMQVDSIAVS